MPGSMHQWTQDSQVCTAKSRAPRNSRVFGQLPMLFCVGEISWTEEVDLDLQVIRRIEVHKLCTNT
jgi:hypothetical protein